MKYQLHITHCCFTFMRLTAWSTVLVEKQTGPQLKFSTLCGTRSFSTVLTTARHMPTSSFCQTNPVHAHPPYHFLKISFSPIIPPTPASSRWSPIFRSPYQNPVCTSYSATCPAHLILLDLITLIIFGVD